MNILHITNDYFNSLVYKQLNYRLLANNVNSFVFVPSANRDAYKKDRNVFQSKCFNRVDRFFFLRKQRKIVKELRKKIAELNPDILHGHFIFSSGYACMQIKKEYNIPYIVTAQSADVNIFFKYMIHLRGTGIQVMLNADKVVFSSRTLRDFVISRYVPAKLRSRILEKTVLKPFGIDDFWLKNLGTKYRNTHDKILHLITVGVINRNKNQLTVARAVNFLNGCGYKPIYTVVGEIKDETIYRKLIKYPFVRHIQNCPKEELIEHYRQADIFVMPSITETFGLVYAEAMSQGLPVIYSAGQGFDGQFHEGDVGYRVDCLNTDEIAQRIIDVYSNHRNLSERCVRLSNKFDWGDITEAYIDLYNEAIKK
ncbi:MAG: glycosyltransferase family 4 protein [Candidatus Omnitrophota bacterium]|jgi:glycosyltransferase involved in cell wall biosynthesis